MAEFVDIYSYWHYYSGWAGLAAPVSSVTLWYCRKLKNMIILRQVLRGFQRINGCLFWMNIGGKWILFLYLASPSAPAPLLRLLSFCCPCPAQRLILSSPWLQCPSKMSYIAVQLAYLASSCNVDLLSCWGVLSYSVMMNHVIVLGKGDAGQWKLFYENKHAFPHVVPVQMLTSL